jgi:hypothetical protein
MVAVNIVIGQGSALGWLNPVVIPLAVALLFSVMMVIVAIIAIAATVPKDDARAQVRA